MTDISWSLEKRKIKDLVEHHKNPRSLSKKQAREIKDSIEKFGLAEKVIINIDNIIIGGHQRVRILKELKHKEVDCWVPSRELTDKEVEELNIRLNKNTGDWDFDILANEWDINDLCCWGFDPKELVDIEVKEKKEKKLKECPSCGHEF